MCDLGIFKINNPKSIGAAEDLWRLVAPHGNKRVPILIQHGTTKRISRGRALVQIRLNPGLSVQTGNPDD